MDAQELARFADFQRLDVDTLRSVARHSRLVTLAAGRWLARPGRRVSGRYYLVHGRVEVDGRRVISPEDVQATEPLVPGHARVRTLEPCVLGHVDWDQIAFLFSSADDREARDSETWLERFLASPLMGRLPPLVMKRVLDALEHRSVRQGEAVVVRGHAASCAYVLEQGTASSGRELLVPGALFGEAALVTGRLHDRTVEMRTHGAVRVLPEPVFMDVLMEAAVLVATTAAGCVPLTGPPSDMRSAALDLNARYAVVSGRPADRLLAALILVQRGFDARVVIQAGTVRPSAHVRRLAMDSACSTDIG